MLLDEIVLVFLPSDIISWIFLVIIIIVSVFFGINEITECFAASSLVNHFKHRMNKYQCQNGDRENVDRMFFDIEHQSEARLKFLVRPFRNSLMVYVDENASERYCNSKCADDFFNEHTIASKICEVRSIFPSLLTGIGVLGTFVGLLFALWGFNDGDALLGNNQIQNEQLMSLLKNAKVAFVTSVWGVSFSLICSVARGFSSHVISKKIEELQRLVDESFVPNISNDNSLRKMGVKTNSVQDCIIDLKNTLVTTLNTNSRESAEYLAKSITQYIADVNEEAIKKAIDNMSGVFDRIFSKYTEALESAGRNFIDSTNKATTTVTIRYTEWSDKFKTLTSDAMNNIQHISDDIEKWGKLAGELGARGEAICGNIEALVGKTSDSVVKCSDLTEKIENLQQNIMDQVNRLDPESEDSLSRLKKINEVSNNVSEILKDMEKMERDLASGIREIQNIKPVMDSTLKNNIQDYSENVKQITKELTDHWAQAYRERADHYEKVASTSMNAVLKAFTKIADNQYSANSQEK